MVRHPTADSGGAVTEVREPGFGVDLPGAWSRIQEAEQGTIVYENALGGDTLTVVLLSVKPMFAIADHKRLLDDYLHHHRTFEKSELADLEQSEATSFVDGDVIEGEWSGVDATVGRRLRHRVLLEGEVLADFCYAASSLDETEFAQRANAVLATARIDAG
jgi:hypothetical protein